MGHGGSDRRLWPISVDLRDQMGMSRDPLNDDIIWLSQMNAMNVRMKLDEIMNLSTDYTKTMFSKGTRKWPMPPMSPMPNSISTLHPRP